MINGERASSGEQGIWGGCCVAFIRVCVCVCVCEIVGAGTYQPASVWGALMCVYVCVCVLIDSLSAIFKPSLSLRDICVCLQCAT